MQKYLQNISRNECGCVRIIYRCWVVHPRVGKWSIAYEDMATIVHFKITLLGCYASKSEFNRRVVDFTKGESTHTQILVITLVRGEAEDAGNKCTGIPPWPRSFSCIIRNLRMLYI